MRMRTKEQHAERKLRNLLRRYQFLLARARPDNHGERGEIGALRWALAMLASDERVPLTETQRATGVLADIAKALPPNARLTGPQRPAQE